MKTVCSRDGFGGASAHSNRENGELGSPHTFMRFDVYCTVVAVLIAAAVISACSEAPTRNALAAYVASADQWIDRCANVRRAPEKISERDEAACVREAQDSVEPLYLAASASVRGQRGTAMYLERYRAEWNAAMTALAHHGRRDERQDSVDQRRRALHDIASKLTNR